MDSVYIGDYGFFSSGGGGGWGTGVLLLDDARSEEL